MDGYPAEADCLDDARLIGRECKNATWREQASAEIQNKHIKCKSGWWHHPLGPVSVQRFACDCLIERVPLDYIEQNKGNHTLATTSGVMIHAPGCSALGRHNALIKALGGGLKGEFLISSCLRAVLLFALASHQQQCRAFASGSRS